MQLMNSGSYRGFSSDVWSLGCVLFNMVTGTPPPFSGMMQTMVMWPELLRILQRAGVSAGRNFRECSEILDCIDLLGKMLDRDDQRRWTMDQVMAHHWLS